MLIKQASQRLLQEFPQLQFLSTLSPTPNLSRWLLTCLDQTLLEPQNPLVKILTINLKLAQILTVQTAALQLLLCFTAPLVGALASSCLLKI